MGSGPVRGSRPGRRRVGGVAGRQGKELDQDEIKERLERFVGQEQGAEEPVHDAGAGANAIRDRLNQALGRGTPEPRQKQQHELDEERKRQRQLELERQREGDRGLGWEL